ncbi:MAG: hypothetical protein HY554_12150 [Elusimicrobia bacterium]|nr:hypothetical protein [Elusimicrobiota bacterium]
MKTALPLIAAILFARTLAFSKDQAKPAQAPAAGKTAQAPKAAPKAPPSPVEAVRPSDLRDAVKSPVATPSPTDAARKPSAEPATGQDEAADPALDALLLEWDEKPAPPQSAGEAARPPTPAR